MPSVNEALEYMKTNDIKWVDLHFTSIDGKLRHKTLSANEINEETFVNGVEAELTELFGFTGKSLILIPDPDSFARVPWEPNTMRLVCNIYSIPEKERFVKDARYSIERVNINTKAMGITDVEIGSECEFYIFDAVTSDKLSSERGANFLIDAREAYWNPSPFWNTKNGAYVGQPHDTLYAARVQIAEIMSEHFRYGIKTHSHGRSANSQQKMKIKEYNAKIAADALLALKYAARNLAFIANNVATFMPFPIANDKGSSLKITQGLGKGSVNLFYDETGEYANLSQTALYYIGGILEHAEALTIFTAPTTNSYKKLKADPRYIAWGIDNANALVCAEFGAGGKEQKITYNGADPSVNPYLAYAAVVAAGLDGIKNKSDAGKPINENLLEVDSKKMKELKIRQLPDSIVEAISALESDNKFLKGFISTELLAEHLEQLLIEHNENEKRPSAYEVERYFNR